MCVGLTFQHGCLLCDRLFGVLTYPTCQAKLDVFRSAALVLAQLEENACETVMLTLRTEAATAGTCSQLDHLFNTDYVCQ